MTHGLYKVIGNRPYRGHQPGTVFEAVIDPIVERRAIQRRDLELLGRVTPTLPAEHRLPEGWPPQELHHQ